MQHHVMFVSLADLTAKYRLGTLMPGFQCKLSNSQPLLNRDNNTSLRTLTGQGSKLDK